MARPVRYHHCAFTIRVTADERRLLRDRTRAARLSLSHYLVEASLAERPLSGADRARRDRALYHLRKVGVHLNQLTRRVNGGAIVPIDALLEAFAAVTGATQQLTTPSEACACPACSFASR
jgi:hypothetical protein